MPADRLHPLDFLRAASVLYIVGFWHMMEYWPSSEGYHNSVTTRITTVVLGLFTFLSGYLLAQKPLSWEAKRLGGFYLRRFLRLYPLYLVALIVFGLTGLTEWRSVVLSAPLLSPFLGHVPLTLWYVAVLLIFYLLAPLLLTTRSPVSLLLRSVAIFGVLVVAVRLLPHADARLVIYFPSFALGIHAARDVLHPRSEWMAGPLALVIIFAAASETVGAFSWLWTAGLAASGSLLLFRWALRSRIARRPSSVVLFVSTAAYVMYLVHRPILLGATALFFPASPGGQLAWLLAVCLPVIVLFSWAAQRAYDAGIALVSGREPEPASPPGEAVRPTSSRVS
jgi:peptidoglycan/LPS O-acetylase OafA/YrhL